MSLRTFNLTVVNKPALLPLQYEQAMQYHIKHAEMADTEGKFVAFTNLGFVSMKLAKWNDAAQFFKANYPILSVDIVSQVSLIQVRELLVVWPVRDGSSVAGGLNTA